jgi:enoyl-[acyl-carrier protein] reductase II
VFKTPYAQKLIKIEDQGMTLEEYNEMTSEKQHVMGAVLGDLENGFINSGQVAGLISCVPSVKELLDSMIEEAKIQMSRSTKDFEAFTS